MQIKATSSHLRRGALLAFCVCLGCAAPTAQGPLGITWGDTEGRDFFASGMTAATYTRNGLGPLRAVNTEIRIFSKEGRLISVLLLAPQSSSQSLVQDLESAFGSPHPDVARESILRWPHRWDYTSPSGSKTEIVADMRPDFCKSRFRNHWLCPGVVPPVDYVEPLEILVPDEHVCVLLTQPELHN